MMMYQIAKVSKNEGNITKLHYLLLRESVLEPLPRIDRILQSEDPRVSGTHFVCWISSTTSVNDKLRGITIFSTHRD